MEDELMEIDRAILSVIRNARQPPSTYGIAKDTRVSWSTANIHCYKLKAIGIISERRQESRFGQSKVLWEIRS